MVRQRRVSPCEHLWKTLSIDSNNLMRHTLFLEWCERCGTLRHTKRPWSKGEPTRYTYDRPRHVRSSSEAL